jgi:hypothetical protein
VGQSEPGRLQDPPDGRGSHLNGELADLALDPWVPPSRILPSQPHDEGSDLRIDGWSAGPAVRVGPLPLDQLAVPAEQSLRRDQERRPAFAGEGPGQSGKHGPVEGPEPRPTDLPSQDRQLVTKDQDLEVLGPVASR